MTCAEYLDVVSVRAAVYAVTCAVLFIVLAVGSVRVRVTDDDAHWRERDERDMASKVLGVVAACFLFAMIHHIGTVVAPGLSSDVPEQCRAVVTGAAEAVTDGKGGGR